MVQSDNYVLDRDGIHGQILDNSQTSERNRVAVQLAENKRVSVPRDLIFDRIGGGHFALLRFNEMPAETDRQIAQQEQTVVPVVEEQVQIAKHTVDTGGIRVKKGVTEEEQTINFPMTTETVDVQRVPVNQEVNQPPVPRQEGDTLIVPVVEEVIYLAKRFVLKEEIRITKRRIETRETQQVTLRKENVSVDRIEPIS